ncbi:transmembrane protein, putative (macronuclear) [Tetrahymena thermophila SB210]|uniref:Transmembrane protein, putative n=1 Tax=Tetrahymena thermophila (strain SB210) TaxID=312017 RepID=Q23WT2_TETTS|nr:transmembrane protein, putative [Tetrahymena thermophila SB210]EAS01013.2 transmembrane protein, putative [Tetrahymena thermophila SB210]|eukprot:XP_001021258.2 transmembrane protein, putative [Tetrahymena thermophila SB210]
MNIKIFRAAKILRILLLSQFILRISKCILCDPKCTYCDSSNNCFQCQQGYKLNNFSGICESGCDEGNYFYEPSQSCLPGCPQGFEIDVNRKACRSINYCDQITYISGNQNFNQNTNSQIFKNLLIVSGKQNLTVNENYLSIYQIKNDDYGFYHDGILNGHDTSIISYTLLQEENLNNILISVSSNLIIAWDMEQGLMQGKINLTNTLYIDPYAYYLDQNILVLNYLNMNQFAIFNHKQWISSVLNSTNAPNEAEFFVLFSKVHPSPIVGYKIQFNNYLISYDQNDMVVKWNIENIQEYKIYQNFNYTISQVFTFPNNLNNNNSDFFIISFEENTQINIILNNNNTTLNYFATNHQSPISYIFFDKNIQSFQADIVQLISISQTELIIFSFNMIDMTFNQLISYQQQVFFAKILNDQVVIAIQNGLNIIQISQQKSNSQNFSFQNVLIAQLQASDLISDIQMMQNQQNTTYIIVGNQLTKYLINNQLSQSGNSTLTNILSKQQKYYKQHYGKVNGVVIDTSQNIYITYSSDGSFGIWDTIQNNKLNLKPLFFQLPPWCNSLQTCQNSILKALVISTGVLLSYYDNNIFITWNVSRYNSILRNTYQLPKTFMNSTNPQQALLRTKFLSNFTQSQITTIKQKCLELEYFQLTQKIVVNYFSLYLTIASLPNLNSTTINSPDTTIITQVYSPIQNQFIIITESTYMWQYLASGNSYTYNWPNFVPVPRRNFGVIQKSQFIVTQAGFSYFQNTGFNSIDNQVFNLIYSNLRVCSVFPFKDGISSISIVNNQLIFVGFVNGNLKVAQYVCSTFVYSTDKCNTQNTIFNPYLKKAYLFNYSKVIVVDLYSKTDTQLAYGHPTTNSVTVIQDSVNGNMISYSKENTQNLYKFNQKTQVATQFLNGHNASVDFVFLDTQNGVLISHATSLTDLKVIVWSYSYAFQLKVFLDIQIFNSQTPIISIVRAAFDQNRNQVLILTYQGTLFTFNYLNYQVSTQQLVPKGLEFYLDPIYLKFYVLYNLYYIQIRNYFTLKLENEIIVSSVLQNQKIIPSNKWITLISSNLITIIDRYKQVYQSTILCNLNCGDYKISDKLNLCFSYQRGNSDNIDVFDNVSGSYLYTINGQQDIDIGAIKLIAIDDVNYLLFIGKLTTYITVFFNYLTRQEVGYTFDNIFLFYGTTMNNQFNALSVADTSTYQSIEEQITSTFKFQDSYIVKTIDYYTSQNDGDIYYVDSYQIVRRYRIQDKMVKIICQLQVYRQIAYFNAYVYILTYTQLLKYSDDFQPISSSSQLNIYGNQILGNQSQFTIINTITLDSPLIQCQFVQQFSDILIITQSGTFTRYNYLNNTLIFQVSAGYYYSYYNLNFQFIILASSLNQDLEFYPYNSILQNFTIFQLTNVTYPNNQTLSKIFIDELYNNLYVVQANDRIIDIYSFQRSILNPSMNITKVNFIPYINTIYSVQLDIYIVSDQFPELVFMAQNTFLAVAYQNITGQNFDLYMIQITLLTSDDVVNYSFSIPIVNGIPQSSYFQNCLIQIQDPKANYQVENLLTNQQSYFSQFGYQSLGIQLKIFGSSFLYYNSLMQTLQAQVQYLGDNQNSNLIISNNFFSQNENEEINISNQNLILTSSPVKTLTGSDQQSIFDFRQNENILLSESQFSDLNNISIISYTNLFQDQISTIIEKNDLMNISSILIQNYVHQNQSSIQFQGTSLFITNSQLNKIICQECTGSFLQFVNSMSLQVLNCTFIQNVGYNGGSIAIIQSQGSQNLIKDSYFTKNIASSSGGAIYMVSSYLKLYNTTFTQNQAVIGGAIRYLNEKPQEFNTQYFQQNNVTFVKNIASIHSQNWGSYIQQLQNIFQVNNLQSGGFISIQFQLFDEENNLVYYDLDNCNNNQYTQDICIELSQIKLTLLSQDDSKVRVVGSYTSYHDEYIKLIQGFQIIGIQLIGNPLSTQYIYLQAEGLFQFFNISSNNLLLPIIQQTYQDQYSLYFRQCEIGEIFRLINSIYQCVQCDVGTYSLQTPSINEEQSCSNCPEQANYCYRSQMTLKEGYWKSANLSDNIYQCQTKTSCNGDQEKNYCVEGHYGPLCQYCDENGQIWPDKFQYDNKNECINCTQRSISTAIGQTLLISLILISYCVFNIISSFKASEKVIQAYYLRLMKLQCIARSGQNNEVNMAVKALTSYLQLFKIISIMTLNLPTIISIIPDLFGSPSSSAVITNACEIALLSSESMPHLYWKSLTMIISPILYILVLLIIYALLIHKKNNFTIKRSHLICSFVFLFQFVQPNIVQTLIAQISCEEFDGKKYIADDYTYECYSYQHVKFIMFLIGPGLAFYSVIYPSFILAIIYKSRKQLNNARIRLRYGYIYQDYNSKGFYWEYVKYTLKIAIILIQNFYSFSEPIYLDKYLQVILDKVPNQLRNSVYYKYFLNKADIHSQRVTQRAIQLWMIIYKKSKFYRHQSPSLIKSSYQDNSLKNLNSSSNQNSPTLLQKTIHTKYTQNSNNQLNSLFSEVDEVNIASSQRGHNVQKKYSIQFQEDRIIENSVLELSSNDKSQEQSQQEKNDQKQDETEISQEVIDIFSVTQIEIPNIQCNSNSKNITNDKN